MLVMDAQHRILYTSEKTEMEAGMEREAVINTVNMLDMREKEVKEEDKEKEVNMADKVEEEVPAQEEETKVMIMMITIEINFI